MPRPSSGSCCHTHDSSPRASCTFCMRLWDRKGLGWECQAGRFHLLTFLPESSANSPATTHYSNACSREGSEGHTQRPLCLPGLALGEEMVRVPDCCWLGTGQVSLAICPLPWPYMGLQQWCVGPPAVAWGCKGQRLSEGPSRDTGPASGDSLRGESGQPVARLKPGKRGTERRGPPAGAGGELEGA